MKYFSVLLTKVVQYEVMVVADDEATARAKAECGPLERVKNKDGVYSVKETSASMSNFDVSVNQIDERLFNTKVYDPSEICQHCGTPFVWYDGCFYCT